MKRRKLLSLLLTVAMAISLIPATVMADDDEKESIEIETVYVEGETVTLEDMADDSDEMFAEFVNRQFGIADDEAPVAKRGAKSRGAASSRGDQLTGNDKDAYDQVVSYLPQLLSGQATSTRIVFPEIEWTCTFAELGVTGWDGVTQEKAVAKFKEDTGFNLRNVTLALLYDYPYEMFWFDKSYGFSSGYSSFQAAYNSTTIFFSYASVINLPVYKEYSATNERGTFELGDVMSRVNAAVSNAYHVVETNSALSDRDKLLAYKDWICENTSYNDEAAALGSAGYGSGNP